MGLLCYLLSHGHPGPDPPPCYESLKRACVTSCGEEHLLFLSSCLKSRHLWKVSDFVWLWLILPPTCLQNRLFTLKAIVALIIRCLGQQHAVWIYSLASVFTWFPREKENKELRDKVGNLALSVWLLSSICTDIFASIILFFSLKKHCCFKNKGLIFFFLSYAGKYT